jgi:hypothetical protein
MDALAEPRARAGPRPDPLRTGGPGLFRSHAPWVLSLVAFAAALLFAKGRDLGLVATGAGWAVVLVAAARGRTRTLFRAAHLACGVLALALLRGAGEAAAFVPAAGVLTVGALAARSFALLVRPGVAPLAGRLPWIFPTSLRGLALRFGGAGLLAAVPLAFAGPSPVLRVIGLAMLPLALRTYLLNLLAERTARAIWTLAFVVEMVLLGVLVPSHGPVGAAWAAVAAETVLCGCGGFVVARQTGVAPLPRLQLAGVACAMALVLLLTVRGNADVLLLTGIVLGVAAGALFGPRRT